MPCIKVSDMKNVISVNVMSYLCLSLKFQSLLQLLLVGLAKSSLCCDIPLWSCLTILLLQHVPCVQTRVTNNICFLSTSTTTTTINR